jgi:hypothetical protein
MSKAFSKHLITLLLVALVSAVPVVSAHAAVRNPAVTDDAIGPQKRVTWRFSGEPDVGQASGVGTTPSGGDANSDLVEWVRWNVLIWIARYSGAGF